MTSPSLVDDRHVVAAVAQHCAAIAGYELKEAAGRLSAAERLRFFDEFYKLGRLVYAHSSTLLKGAPDGG